MTKKFRWGPVLAAAYFAGAWIGFWHFDAMGQERVSGTERVTKTEVTRFDDSGIILAAGEPNTEAGTPADFEIDGTQVCGDDNAATGAGDDWGQNGSCTGVADPADGITTVQFTDCNWGRRGDRGDATQFGSASEDDGSNTNFDLIGCDPGQHPWEWNGIGGNPQKDDITNVYVHRRWSCRDSGAECDPEITDDCGVTDRCDAWLFLGLETRATNGDRHADFEINQRGLFIIPKGASCDPANGTQVGCQHGEACCDDSQQQGRIIGAGPIGGRAIGDLLVTFDYERGGEHPILSIRAWTAGATYADVTGIQQGVNVFGFVNQADEDVTNFPWFGFDTHGAETQVVKRLQFVEVAIDLTDLGIDFPDACLPNATVMAKTRSSQSVSAELKDWELHRFPVVPPPDCEAEGDEVCDGFNATLRARGSGGKAPYTITWRDGPEDSDNIVGTPCTDVAEGVWCNLDFTPATSGDADRYYATVVDRRGCEKDPCPADLDVNPNPTADAGSDDDCLEPAGSLDVGGSPTATGGTPGYTYLWAGAQAGCLSSTTDANPTLDKDCAGVGTHELCVTITDSEGCTDDDCGNFVIHPEPTADAGDDITDCFDDFASDPAVGGSPTASGGTPSYTYLWTGDRTDCLSSTGAANPTFDVSCAGPGEYDLCVLVTDSKGCVDDDCMVLTVHPEPTADAGDDITDCFDDFASDPAVGGSPTASGGTPSYTYLWSGDRTDCLSSTGAANPTFDLSCAGPGVYDLCVLVTDSNGCRDDDCMVLTVYPEPTADAGDDKAECLEDPTDPSIGGSPTASGGTPTYTIAWSGDRDDCLSCTDCANPTFDLSCAGPGDYDLCVLVTDSNGCHDDDCMTVTVHPEPTADAGEDKADCLEAPTDPQIGGSPTASGGTPGYTYLWTGLKAGCLDDATAANPTFDLSCAGVGDHDLCVLVTDSNGCFDDDCMMVTVHPEPVCTINPLNVTVGNGVITITGAPVTGGTPPYSCTASFNAPSGWVVDNNGCTVTASMIQVTFTIPSPGTAAASAVLSIDISDFNGCLTDCSTDVGIDVGCTARPNQEVCEGDPDDLLSVVCADVEISSPSALVEIFQFDGNIPCPSADALGSGAFTPVKVCAAVANLGECCTDGDPPSDTPGVLTYCALTTESNGLTAVCDARTTIDPNPTADAGEDQADCREAPTDPQIGGDPTASGGTPSYTFLWSGARDDCLSCTNCANPTFDLDCPPAGTYELCVLVTDSNGCEDEDCVDVTVHPEPTADAGDDITDCFDDFTSDPAVGGSPTASGGTPGYTFLWTGDRTDCLSSTTTSNPTFDVSCAGAGEYDLCVLVTDSNGCEDDDCMVLTVHPEPTADAGDDISDCFDDFTSDPQVGGSPTASGGTPGYTFLWTGDRTDCLSNTGAANPTFDVSCAGAGEYDLCVLVTDSNGCEDEDCMVLTVHPEPTADAGDDISDCFDDFASDPAVGGSPTASGGTPGYTFLWTGDRTDCLSSTTVSNPTFDVSCAGPGIYDLCVLVTDSNGCEDEDCMVLTVHPEPTCTVDPPDAEICSTQTQRFCAVPDGGTPGYTFSWTGPNSFSSNAECITVSDAGTYTVTVTDANGCTHDCDGVLTVVPCNQACSPGFWRNHDDDWCDENDPFLQPTDGHCPPPAPSAATTFLGAFGLGSCPNAPITISSSLTLLEAVSVAGGDNQTLFHCSAALLSSQVVAFPVLASDVQAVVQEACTGTDFFPGEVVDWGRAFSICAGWNAVESEPNGCCPFSPPDNPECPLPGALGLRGPDVRMLEVKSPTGR